MRWTVEVLNATVRAELEAQPKDIRARYLRIVRLIETHGLERVREPYVKHLEGPLWEMRMKGRDRIARAVYEPPPAGASSWSRYSARRPRRHPDARSSGRSDERRR
jgi:Phage derived protein Gp49-like (DUF891)